MQQRKFQQVRRLGETVTTGHQFGAADRKKLLGAQTDSVESAPIAVAVSDRDVDILTGKVDMMHRCGDPQIDTRMRLGKAPQAIDQPFCSEIRRRADGESPGVLTLHDALGAGGDPVERIAYHDKIFAAGIRED